MHAQQQAERKRKAAEEAKRKAAAARAEVGLPATASDAELAQRQAERKAAVKAAEQLKGAAGSESGDGLLSAAWRGDVAAMQSLLDEGFDVSFVNAHGKPALHYAAWAGRAGATTLLLEEGADVAIKDKDGNTALHMAAMVGVDDTAAGDSNTEGARALLAAGADVFLANAAGHTAKEIAAGNGLDAVQAAIDDEVARRATEAGELKGKGNAALKAHRYDEAIQAFEAGIALYQTQVDHVLFGGRSAAHAGKADWAKAKDDAERALEIKGNWGKGYWHKGEALRGAGDLAGALAAFETGVGVAPGLKMLEEAVDSVKAQMKQAEAGGIVAEDARLTAAVPAGKGGGGGGGGAHSRQEPGSMIEAMLLTATALLGLNFSTTGPHDADAPAQKFEADALELGLPVDAGLGIAPFLNYSGGEGALLKEAGAGLPAIKKEMQLYGSADDKECTHYILHEEAGSSKRKFQNGWMRDCDPDKVVVDEPLTVEGGIILPKGLVGKVLENKPEGSTWPAAPAWGAARIDFGGRIGDVWVTKEDYQNLAGEVLPERQVAQDAGTPDTAPAAGCFPCGGSRKKNKIQPDEGAAGGDKRGMRFADFCLLPIATMCKLTEAEVLALRYRVYVRYSVYRAAC